MNKNTKIRLNYLVGAVISLVLFWGIYIQVTRQLHNIDPATWRHTGPLGFLIACVVLMFANTSLEGVKWFLLCRSVEPLSYSKAFSSYLAGVAFASITPNRIGEYPGRILFLSRSNTFRYINVSVLGVTSQLWSVYIFGLGGLLYYNITFPGVLPKVGIVLCLLANVLAALAYWRFESWLPFFEKIKWLKKFAIYGKLLTRITPKRQLAILGISMLRFMIFAAQYLFLLRWMNVNVPLAEGFCMVALFFWIMAIIPSISLTELGIRGNVSIQLFQHFSSNSVGMLSATAGLWLLNLVIPSIIGSILIFRMRLLS